MISVRRALGFSFASEYFAQLIQLSAVLVVSRLLTPAEVGIYSIAAVVLFAASFLRTLGVSQYFIREPELTPQKIRSGLGPTLITAWGIGGALVLAAPALAEFYDEPGLFDIFTVIAVTFVLTPFIAVPYALLLRDMATDKTILVQSGSAITQVVVTTVLAYLGFGYMSMAWGVTAGVVVEFLIVNSMVKIPKLPSFSGVLEIFKFGSQTAFSGLLEKIGEGVPDLVLGRTGTMVDVSMYSRGLGVVMIFNRIVTSAVRPVILPHFSNEYRATKSVKGAYTRAVELQTGLAWPFFAAFSAATLPIIRVLYGDQWDEAAPVAELLAIWAPYWQ